MTTIKNATVIKSLFVSLLITFMLAMYMAVLIALDVQAGALQGASETGWGVAIALFIVGPVFLFFVMLSTILAVRSRKKGLPVKPTLYTALIVSAVMIATAAAASFILSLVY